MKKMIFLSRHAISDEQKALAEAKGYELIQGNDIDAFSVTPADVKELYGEVDAVCVVHPAAALRLSPEYSIGLYERNNRQVDDAVFRELHVY
jgi:hypothetical protein